MPATSAAGSSIRPGPRLRYGFLVSPQEAITLTLGQFPKDAFRVEWVLLLWADGHRGHLPMVASLHARHGAPAWRRDDPARR